MKNVFKKTKIIAFLLILFIPALAVFAQSNNKDLVYLKVQNAKVSSFDDTPDWAPLQNPLSPVDGDLSTRWSSKLGVDNQWIYFDFGKNKTVSKIKIRWERAYPLEYKISVSDDALSWKEVKYIKEAKGGNEVIDINPPVATRYIKVDSVKRINPEWGVSMWEFEAYGPKDKNPEDKKVESVFPSLKESEEPTLLKMEEPKLSPGSITKQEFQKGVVYTSWSRYELGSKASDATLENLKQKGINSIAIMVVWLQDTVDSKEIYSDIKDTPTDEALAHVINKAHFLGLKVMLKPHVDVKDGSWRGLINPNPEWFKSYRDFIIKYANLSQQYNVELYCIGTELSNVTGVETWDNKWLELIDEIKKIYKGPLTYGANWDEYLGVSFWEKLDFIGIDAYFPLTDKNNPSKEELIIAWQGHADKIENWLKNRKLNMPVIFSEIGYSSCDGTNKQPFFDFKSSSPDKKDEDEQVDCLDAMATVLKDRPWFRGMYWWQYFPTERYNPLGWIINGKKAEVALFDLYKKMK